MSYIWSISDSYPEKLIGYYDRTRSPDRLLFMEGNVIKNRLEKVLLTFRASKKTVSKYNNLQSTSGLPLVDAKIREIMDEIAENDVQYFDAVIECTDGIIDDYKIVNITHAVMAINHITSSYNTITGSDVIFGFKKLVLQPNCLGSHAIARDREYMPNILVNQQLFDAFKKHKITGVDLITTEEFNSIGPI